MPGFVTGSHPTVIRHHGQPAPTIHHPAQRPQPDTATRRNAAADPSPLRPAPAKFHAAATIPRMRKALYLFLQVRCVIDQVGLAGQMGRYEI